MITAPAVMYSSAARAADVMLLMTFMCLLHSRYPAHRCFLSRIVDAQLPPRCSRRSPRPTRSQIARHSQEPAFVRARHLPMANAGGDILIDTIMNWGVDSPKRLTETTARSEERRG